MCPQALDPVGLSVDAAHDLGDRPYYSDMRLQPSGHLDPVQPFSRSDARAAGLPPTTLLGPHYRRLFYDVYVSSACRVDTVLRATAALAVAGPTAVLSHATAAAFWGAVVPHDEDVHVSLPDGSPRCERRGIRAHRALQGAVVSQHQGLTVSSPLQALREMAADGVNLVDLVVAGDSLLKQHRFSLLELKAAAAGWVGRGAKVARRAARYLREGVDSAMESRLRMLLVLAGLPEPKVNLILRSPNGDWRMRFDLCYRHLKLIIEYDGRQHAESTSQWRHDIRRREELDRLGWRVVVIDADGIYAHPGETLDRVHRLLRELGCRPLRRTYLPEWQRHFPGRG